MMEVDMRCRDLFRWSSASLNRSAIFLHTYIHAGLSIQSESDRVKADVDVGDVVGE